MIVDFINLDRFADRRREFMTNNAHLRELRRCSKFDGRELDVRALAESGVINKDITNTYTAGALGLALAHISLWDRAIETGQVVTVCEDDAIFHHDFEQQAEAIISRLPANWDVLLYGWNFDSMLLIDMLPGVSPSIVLCDEDQLRTHVEEFQRRPLSPQPIKVLQAFGSCYSLSPKGAKALKSFSLPIRPMSIALPTPSRNLRSERQLSNIGIDVIMSAAYPELSAFITFPPLVVSKNEQPSSTLRQLRTLSQETPPGERPQASAVDNVVALNKLGMELQKANRPAEALAHYDKALMLEPNDIAALSNRGSVLIDLNRFEEALSNYDRLLSNRPNDFNALNMRGLILENLKRSPEALASYDKAISLNTGSIEALYNRGNVLADLARFEEALKSYDKALQINPGVPAILNNRGLVLEELNRFSEALASYDKALKIKPDYDAASENRKLVLNQLERSPAT